MVMEKQGGKAYRFYVDGRFEKTLPREGCRDLLKKINTFIREYYDTVDKKILDRKYSIKKINAQTRLKEVWKFKIDRGDRVLYTKAKYLNIESNLGVIEDENVIVLLAYCNHDQQIKEARNKDAVHIEEWIEADIDKTASECTYNEETQIIRAFNYLDLMQLENVDRLQGLFHLNKEQRKSVNTMEAPFLLFGSAGSGKTTIGIYKIIQLIKALTDPKIGYFTYSEQLLRLSEAMYTTVVRNELQEEEREAGSVTFESILHFIKQEANAVCGLQCERIVT